MSKHRNVETCSLTLHKLLHDEDKDVDDDGFVDDNVYEDNSNTNKTKITALIHASSESPNNSL